MRAKPKHAPTITFALAGTLARPNPVVSDTPKSCATIQNCPLIVPKHAARCLEFEKPTMSAAPTTIS